MQPNEEVGLQISNANSAWIKDVSAFCVCYSKPASVLCAALLMGGAVQLPLDQGRECACHVLYCTVSAACCGVWVQLCACAALALGGQSRGAPSDCTGGFSLEPPLPQTYTWQEAYQATLQAVFNATLEQLTTAQVCSGQGALGQQHSNSSAAAAELSMGAKQGGGGCLHAAPLSCTLPPFSDLQAANGQPSPPRRCCLPSLPLLACLLHAPLAQTHAHSLPHSLTHSPQAVNDWVSEATRGKITEVVTDDIVRQASLLQHAASPRFVRMQLPCPPASSARLQPMPREPHA